MQDLLFQLRGRRAQPLTPEDLTDEGWAKKSQELSAVGIDPGTYLEHRLPKLMRTDPRLHRALERVRMQSSEREKERRAFYRRGYLSTRIGLGSVILVFILRHSFLWSDSRPLVLAIGAAACLVVVVTTGLALVSLVRYLRAPPDAR